MDFTPEQKAEIARQIEEATAGLAAKRDELLSEVKALRKGKAIDPAELERVEAERDTLKAELAKAGKDLKTAQQAAADATKALESESGFTANLLIENGLRDALVENKVAPQYQKAAIALLKSQGVQIVADGDKRVAKLGDKPLGEAVKAWAASDEGKHYVSAGGNSGGGAGGGGSGGEKGKTMTRSEYESAAPDTRAAFFKEGGKLVNDAA